MPVPIAIAVLALAHVFDWFTFMIMVGRHGLAAEANPIVRHLAEQLGAPGLTFAKIVAVWLAAAVFAILIPKNRRLAMVVLVFGIGAGLVGGISNILAT
jgi:hypothetical protein